MLGSNRKTLAAAAFSTLAFSFCSALEVSPDSPCASKCIDRNDGNPSWRNQSLTFNDMLPCYNWEYSGDNSTAAALKFRTCQECQMNSGWRTTFMDEGTQYTEQDSTWFLFNNKGVVDFCIFGRFENERNSNISSSSIYQRCSDSCSKIHSSIDYNIKSDPGSFDFCEHNTNANFTADAESCATCLYGYEDLTILGNVLSTVQDMCVKKPGRNYTVPSNVTVYAAERIQLSTTESGPWLTSSGPSLSGDESGSSLSKGAIAGVVLGGLVAIIAVLGLMLLLLKRRKNKVKGTTKAGELDAPTALPPSYHYDPVQQAVEDRYSYADEAPMNHARLEMGVGQGPSELPAASTPNATR